MTQQEKQEIDKKCDEFCEYRRTHSNGYPPREWFMAGVKALDEIRKPSEPKTNVGETGEELVERILNIMDNNAKEDDSEAEYLLGGQFEEVATEIAALMQPDNELFEALKKICKVAPSYIKNPDDELDNAICDAMLAVYDYELNEETK